LSQDEFVIRVSHLKRWVAVYDERLDRWELEHLQDLVATVPFTHTFSVTFTHARKKRRTEVKVGWLTLRLPDTHQRLWAVVIYDPSLDRTLVLLTNVPLFIIADVRQVYDDWRLRPRVEHGYRALIQTLVTLFFLSISPFPHQDFTYGCWTWESGRIVLLLRPPGVCRLYAADKLGDGAEGDFPFVAEGDDMPRVFEPQGFLARGGDPLAE